jgi:hypothetical protein
MLLLLFTDHIFREFKCNEAMCCDKRHGVAEQLMVLLNLEIHPSASFYL